MFRSAWFLVITLFSACAVAQELDFTGTYVLTGAKGDFRFDKDMPRFILQVTQSSQSVTITSMVKGKMSRNTFNLDREWVQDTNGALAKAWQERNRLVLEQFIPLDDGGITALEEWRFLNSRTVAICGTAVIRSEGRLFEKRGCKFFRAVKP